MSNETLTEGSAPLLEKWGKALDGIKDPYIARCTAVLLENQARAIMNEQQKMVNEDISAATTTTGKLGTFQKFAFPLVRRVFPELIANKIVGVQPMEGPTSQIFYLGGSRQWGSTEQNLFSKYNLTYRGFTSSAVGSGFALSASFTPALSSLYNATRGSASTTYGGQIAAWPIQGTTLGYNISAGERLTGTGIPEVNFHIEQQPVVARTRKMRTLWTIEANQDLKAYHNLDLEKELTDLMGKELELEIDRELIEDLRGLAYNPNTKTGIGGWYYNNLDVETNSNSFPAMGGGDPNVGNTVTTGWTPVAFLYDYTSAPANPFGATSGNVFVIDFTQWTAQGTWAPQHVGHVYSNLLALINIASADIYKSTQRGGGNWLLTSPLMASLMESAAKLEGGLSRDLGPTTNDGTTIQYKGKFAGKYDLYVDPLYPDDEILMGYKGSNPMDTGFVYSPYIPIEALPAVTDPDSFNPRKGIMTRYGKAAVAPASRFYRVIRVIGASSNFLFPPFGQSGSQTGS